MTITRISVLATFALLAITAVVPVVAQDKMSGGKMGGDKMHSKMHGKMSHGKMHGKMSHGKMHGKMSHGKMHGKMSHGKMHSKMGDKMGGKM